jgi:hypothetical protein
VVAAHDALATFLRSTEAFLALVEEIADAAWSVRPVGEEWSAAETVEHVVLTNRATLKRLRDRTGATPIDGAARFPDARIVEQMFHGVPAPPGAAEPTGRFATRAEGVAALVAVREDIAKAVREAGDRLRDVGFVHPVFGMFDGVQWVLFVGAHTDNHVPQLQRLRG